MHCWSPYSFRQGSTRDTHVSSNISSSTYPHIQFSPGSSDRTTGCFVALKCFVACLFLEESQQPTWPQLKHSRKCTQLSPIFRHSSQPLVFGLTRLIGSRCVQLSAIILLPRIIRRLESECAPGIACRREPTLR